MTWRASAACSEVDTNVFFDAAHGFHEALAICEGCDVRLECLDDRLATVSFQDLDDGIWGGMTPAERDRERYKRRNS